MRCRNNLVRVVLGLVLGVAAAATSAPARAAVSFINAGTSGNVTLQNSPQSFTYTAQAGDTLVLFGTWGTDNDQRLSTWITDSAGNTWVNGDFAPSNGHQQSLGVAVATNVKGGTFTITLNFTAFEFFVAATVLEYSGVDAANPINAHSILLNPAPGTGANAISSGPATTSAANAMIVCGWVNVSHDEAANSGTAPLGFAARSAALVDDTSDDLRMQGEDAVLAGPGTTNCAWTATDGSNDTIAALVALAPGTSAPPPVPISITRTSSFSYDAATGLLTQEVIEPDTPALRLETDYTLDAFGHKTQATVSGVDIATRSTTTTYDSLGQFATTVTNALNQSETWAYDNRTGQPSQHTGPNGLTTSWGYDFFGRKTLETRADGTQTTYQYLYCSGVNGGGASCPSGAAYLAQATPLASDGKTQNGPQSTTYFDALGRVIAQDTQGFDGSLIRILTQYDSAGRVHQKSRPFFVSNGTPKFTVYAYDALGRVVTETFPDSSTTQHGYSGLTTSVTNSLNQTTTTARNDQGLIASVTDAAGKVTSYQYDPFGNLAVTTDPAGNTTTNGYDTRGRKTSISDPDIGVWNYSYDTLSELVSQTDAKGQITSFQYDPLGRLTQRVEPDMTCAWVYDNALGKGIGKLATASISTGPSSGYQRSYTYDSLGRPIQVQFTVDGTTYSVATTYDAASRVSTATYPSGLQVQYSYTALGYVQQLQQLVNGTAGQVYWIAKARDAELHLTQQQTGNGVVTNQGFDPNTGRLTTIQAGVTATEVENLAFVYDTLGNLTTRSDTDSNPSANLSEGFVYDALNRLTSSTITGSPASPAAKSFTYDVLGNITAKSDVGTYHYPASGAALPHAVTSIDGGTITATFTYDANGNETSGLGRTIGYASFNKPNSISQGAINVSFTHDTEHQRLKKLDTSGGLVTSTLYLGAGPVYAEKVSSNAGSTVTWNEYLVAEGQLIGVRFDTVSASPPTVITRYFHKDHLGSVAALTDETGIVVQRLSYDPWGKQRDPATWADDTTGNLPSQDQTTRGYTGQEQLADVGLVHLNGRVYDPLLGRFTSADPVVQDPFNAQSLNRYSYVYDNPLAFTDPDGLCFLGLCHLFHSIERFLSNPLNIVAVAVAIVFVQPEVVAFIGSEVGLAVTVTAAGTLEGAGAAAATVLSGAIGGALAGGITGGSVTSALTGGITGGIFAEVGNITQGWAVGPNNSIDIGGLAESSGVHALAGGVTSVIQGGDFKSGFLSAGFSELAGPEIDSLTNGDKFLTGIGRVVLGGTAAAIGGGNFANGATTAAFSYLFNQALHAGAAGAGAGAGAGTGLLEGLGAAASRLLGVFGSVLSLAGDTPQTSDPQYVIRGGLATPDNLITGSVPVAPPYNNLTGFSVTTGPALTVDQLARIANYPNGQISVTTVQDLAAIGVPVVPTPFPGQPLHGTAVVPIPLDPARAATISDVFQRIPNPARQQ